MTLKLDQYLANIVSRECKISHLKCKVFGGPKSKLKGGILDQIKSEYGDSFCEDADYMLFFKGGDLNSDPEALKKLFGVVNRALGNSANSLSQSDFKTISHEEKVGTEDGSQEEKVVVIDYVFVKITLN